MAKKNDMFTLDDFMADDEVFEPVDDLDEDTPGDVDDEEEEGPDESEEEPKKKKKAENPDPDTTPDPEEEEEDDDKHDDPGPDGDEGEDGVNPREFFEEVERITGFQVELEDTDIDLSTPQGVAAREKVLREQAVDGFLEELKDSHPKVYQAMQYAYSGRDISDLFSTVGNQRDYSKVEIQDGDDELARQVLREYYQSKGVKNESKLKNLILTEEESEEGLVGAAKAVVKELSDQQEADRQTKLEQASREQAEQKRRDRAFVSAIDDIVDSGKVSTFKLAGNREISDFKKFLVGSIQRTTDNGYAFVTPVESRDLEKQLQYEYFRFKNGDLSKLIQVKAESENAKKLKFRMMKDKKKKGSSAEEEHKIQSLKDFYL